MKLPLLIAYYKQDEEEKWFLSKKVIFKIDDTVYKYKQNIEVEKKLKSGNEYSIKEIIDQMIKYSDNEASIFLEWYIPLEKFQKVFKDIWISFPEIIDGSFDNNIKILDYASFFRILYNASYLNKQNSQEVLNLLTKSKFTDWIVGWLPDIDVSHKFGERTIFGNNGIERMQLHDCGIIYYPQHPYILCVMTRWYDREKLKNVLQEISKVVYDKVNETYKKNNG